ncbi:nucleoside hydrolase [Rothia sp. AR01]|uniref:Nucleoside hydrolase n=1 Tax=Rothia santali TaxID=2949643 RepID=A0A9X2KIL7_9MICC|nr:nucleoside hydrolase [Rothia santali]MCP3426160.1 nucleoside hydrolase [Rothia santali]
MRLIIDCDPGNGVPGANVDDGLAIALALGSEGLPGGVERVEAITTVGGNTPARVGAGVARELLRAAGREDVPVRTGAEAALVEPSGPGGSTSTAAARRRPSAACGAGTRSPPRPPAPRCPPPSRWARPCAGRPGRSRWSRSGR